MLNYDVEITPDEEDALTDVLTEPTEVKPGYYANGQPMRPLSPRQAREFFGQPGTASCMGYTVRLPHPIHTQTSIKAHLKVGDIFNSFLAQVSSDGYWSLITSIRGYHLGTRQYRLPRGGDARIHPSSWGIALTVNAEYNVPTATPLEKLGGKPTELTSQGKPGYSLYPDHPLVILASQYGLMWCGHKLWPDDGFNGQHSQYAGLRNTAPDPSTFVYAAVWDVPR